MATVVDRPSSATHPQSSPQQAATAPRADNTNGPLSSTPVEMKTLPPAATGSSSTPAETTTQVTNTTDAPQIQTAIPSVSEPISLEPAQPPVTPAARPLDLTRSETEAIGPSTDTPAANPDNTNGPVLVIMLLLTTGARHPYKIDERYLKKRNITIEDMDPYNISVYTLKELIWRDWREEWEPRPTSHSSIRLIHFGRMLDDKSPLKDCRFQADTPNVVHMTVKPQDVVDEEDAKIAKGGNRRDDSEEPTAGCRCVIL